MVVEGRAKFQSLRPGFPLFSMQGRIQSSPLTLFGGASSRADRHDKMPRFTTTVPLTPEQRLKHWRELKALQKQASRGGRMENASQRHYGAKVILENGRQAVGINMQASRETVVCDLPLAIGRAFQDTLLGKGNPDVKVKTIYLVNANREKDNPIPCADCQEWLNSDLVSPDAQIIGLHRDEIKVRTVAEMLPLHRGSQRGPSMSELPLERLPVTISEQAVAEVEKAGVTEARLRNLLAKARDSYAYNGGGDISGKPAGSAVLFTPAGLTFSMSRFDWTHRWFEAADRLAAATGFQYLTLAQSMLEKLRPLAKYVPEWLKRFMRPLLQPPRLAAVAYYGEDPQLPSIGSLGRLARYRGSARLLIVTVERDVIQVRTLSDYLPELYRTRS